MIATTDQQGPVNMGVFSRPHFFEDQSMALTMTQHLTHSNLQSKPYSAYLFLDDGPGYQGKILANTFIHEALIYYYVLQIERACQLK